MIGQGVESFEEYSPLFWRVVAELAADGYVIPPDEAGSLIGLFRAGSWERVRQTYDPGRSPFRAYLSRAFYRFARREILRQQDRRWRLADVSRLDLRAGPEPEPVDEAVRREELEAVAAALARLSPGRRALLLAFLDSGRPSERDVARAFGLTRHRVREELTDSLGQIATELGHRWPRSPADDRVARSLWREGESVGEASQRLGLTTAEIRASRSRMFRQLVALVRGRPSLKDLPAEGTRMSGMNVEALLVLFKECLLHPGAVDLLERVRAQAEEMRDALEQAEELGFELTEDEARRVSSDCAWTAKVHGTLDPGVEDVEGRSEVGRAIDALRADEAARVADAFAQLMDTVNPEFRNLDSWFGRARRASPEGLALLRREPDVREGGEHARRLIAYGLTPLGVASAARAVQLLADRVIDQARSDPDDWPEHPVMNPLWHAVRDRMQGEPRPSVDLAPREGDAGPEAIPHDLLVAQIRGTSGCHPEVAAPLLAWMVAIADLKPFFFPGYQAESTRRGLRLAQEVPGAEEDILWRWTHTLAYA